MKGGYTHVSLYKLKADAPDDAMNSLSEHFVAPGAGKLLADGTIVEYEIDEMAIHTAAPGTFIIVYITADAGGAGYGAGRGARRAEGFAAYGRRVRIVYGRQRASRRVVQDGCKL